MLEAKGGGAMPQKSSAGGGAVKGGVPDPARAKPDPRLDPRRSLGMPWLALCAALAIHVAEEIATGFLSASINASIKAL